MFKPAFRLFSNPRQSSVVGRLTRMNMLVSAAALVTACAAFFGYDLASFRTAIVEGLSTQAQIAASNTVTALLFNDPQSAVNTLAALKVSPSIVYSGILLPDGRVFAEYRQRAGTVRPQFPAMPPAQAEAHWLGHNRAVLAHAIVFQGRRLGTIWIESDLDRVNNRLKHYAGIAGIVLIGSLLAALLVAPIFQGAIAAPIVALARTAQEISRSKDYSARAAPRQSEGEISVLVESFNEMLAQIQSRDAELRQAHGEMERRVLERTAELGAANKELEAFSYSVSHDLRAPLRQIDGFSAILMDQCAAELSPDARRYLQRVRDRAHHMGHLVDDLLSMGRIGRQVVRRRDTDINELISGIQSDLAPECEGRRIEWRIANLPQISCDPGLAKIVFMNLLSNALKYSRDREVAVIEVGHLAGENAPVFFVRDNGAGFDMRYADKLFGVFQRLHRSDEFEGTGVGLATVQRVVQKHGGHIWAEAQLEKGATFFFTFTPGRPRAKEDSKIPAVEVLREA